MYRYIKYKVEPCKKRCIPYINIIKDKSNNLHIYATTCILLMIVASSPILFSSKFHVTHWQLVMINQLLFQVTNKNWCTTEKYGVHHFYTASQKRNDWANEKSSIFRLYNNITFNEVKRKSKNILLSQHVPEQSYEAICRIFWMTLVEC